MQYRHRHHLTTSATATAATRWFRILSPGLSFLMIRIVSGRQEDCILWHPTTWVWRSQHVFHPCQCQWQCPVLGWWWLVLAGGGWWWLVRQSKVSNKTIKIRSSSCWGVLRSGRSAGSRTQWWRVKQGRFCSAAFFWHFGHVIGHVETKKMVNKKLPCEDSEEACGQARARVAPVLKCEAWGWLSQSPWIVSSCLRVSCLRV